MLNAGVVFPGGVCREGRSPGEVGCADTIWAENGIRPQASVCNEARGLVQMPIPEPRTLRGVPHGLSQTAAQMVRSSTWHTTPSPSNTQGAWYCPERSVGSVLLQRPSTLTQPYGQHLRPGVLHSWPGRDSRPSSQGHGGHSQAGAARPQSPAQPFVLKTPIP